MSRIGRKEIIISDGASVAVNKNTVTVKGPKGELSYSMRPEIKMSMKENVLSFSIAKETAASNAFWGMTRALISNMIEGVTKGFEKKLELVGVGYRVSQNGKGLTLALGYSHPINFDAPQGITLKLDENKSIVVSGVDKQLVGQTAAKIRSLRKPEVYKGKGVRYSDEVVKTKPGKSGKV